MKGKARNIVGIVLCSLLFPSSAYGAFAFYFVFALAYDLNGGFKGEGIGTALALTIVFALIMILSLVFLVLCAVKLAKINKKEKAIKLGQASLEEIE